MLLFILTAVDHSYHEISDRYIKATPDFQEERVRKNMMNCIKQFIINRNPTSYTDYSDVDLELYVSEFITEGYNKEPLLVKQEDGLFDCYLDLMWYEAEEL